MKEKDIQTLVARFLDAETTLEEEQTLYDYFQGEDVAVDLMPYREVFQGLAAVKGIDKPEQEEKPAQTVRMPAWVVALRTVASMAAVFLVGLFFFENGEAPEVPLQTIAATPTEPIPELCEGSTPRELYMCYMERKREQPSTYSLIKQKIYESQH